MSDLSRALCVAFRVPQPEGKEWPIRFAYPWWRCIAKGMGSHRVSGPERVQYAGTKKTRRGTRGGRKSERGSALLDQKPSPPPRKGKTKGTGSQRKRTKRTFVARMNTYISKYQARAQWASNATGENGSVGSHPPISRRALRQRFRSLAETLAGSARLTDTQARIQLRLLLFKKGVGVMNQSSSDNGTMVGAPSGATAVESIAGEELPRFYPPVEEPAAAMRSRGRRGGASHGFARTGTRFRTVCVDCGCTMETSVPVYTCNRILEYGSAEFRKRGRVVRPAVPNILCGSRNLVVSPFSGGTLRR